MDRFDRELKSKLATELKDIKPSDSLAENILKSVYAHKSSSFTYKLKELLDYEIRIPYGPSIACIILVSVLSINTLLVTNNDIKLFQKNNIIKITSYSEVQDETHED